MVFPRSEGEAGFFGLANPPPRIILLFGFSHINKMLPAMKQPSVFSPPAGKQVFLWMAFLPAAWFGALLAASIVQYSVPPAELLTPGDGALFRLITAHAVWGFVFVWLGTRIAPDRKIPVAIALAGFSLLYLGLTAGHFMKTRQWPELTAPLAGMVCAVGCARHLIKTTRDPGHPVRDDRKTPSSQKVPELTPRISVVRIPLPEEPADAPAGQRRKKAASSAKKAGLCSCAQSLPVTKFRHWPGTKDSVQVLFCQNCDRPIEDAWAVEPAYSKAQSKLRPPYKL
jgi:hypothetical protein